MSLKHFLYRLNRRDIPFFPFFKFPKYSKFVIFTLLLIFSAYLTHKIYAQNIILEKQEAFKQGNNQEAWLNNAVGTNMVTGINILAGEIPEDTFDTNYQLSDESEEISYNQWMPGGAIGMTNNLMADLYGNPPASGVEYLAQVKNDFLGKPAYAQSQGIGFRGLQPILPMWRYFRNLVYSLISVYFVIVGIMIMLKVKISPQATISIQNSIPRIFTTLILVTFSYAIAGLLIDFMYIIQGIGLYMLFQIKGTPLTQNLITTGLGGDNTFEALNQANMTRNMNLLGRLLFIGGSGFFTVIGGIISGVVGSVASGLGLLSIAGFSGMWWGALFGVVFFILLILLFILIQMFQLLMGLFKCYVGLIFQIIFAPIIIATGIFPSSKTDFSSWLKQVLGNIIVFPATFLFLVFVNVLISVLNDSFAQNGYLWAPAIVSFGKGIGIKMAIGLTSFLILPKIPALLPQIIFGIKPSPWGQATEQSLASIQKNPVLNFAKRQAGGYMQEKQRLVEGEEEADQELANPTRLAYNRYAAQRNTRFGRFVTGLFSGR